VCPETDEEEDGFDDLEEMVSTHQTSSAVGWEIQLRKQLLLKRERIRELKKNLCGAFQRHQSSNWALKTFLGLVMLTYLLPDTRIKADHTKIVTFIDVRF